MKALLLYFFLALLFGHFLLSGGGTVQAKTYTEDGKKHFNVLIASVYGQICAETRLHTLNLISGAGLRPTCNLTGREEGKSGVREEISVIIDPVVYLPPAVEAENQGGNIRGFGAGLIVRGSDAEETITADYQTRSQGENLHRKLGASFFDRFL